MWPRPGPAAAAILNATQLWDGAVHQHLTRHRFLWGRDECAAGGCGSGAAPAANVHGCRCDKRPRGVQQRDDDGQRGVGLGGGSRRRRRPLPAGLLPPILSSGLTPVPSSSSPSSSRPPLCFPRISLASAPSCHSLPAQVWKVHRAKSVEGVSPIATELEMLVRLSCCQPRPLPRRVLLRRPSGTRRWAGARPSLTRRRRRQGYICTTLYPIRRGMPLDSYAELVSHLIAGTMMTGYVYKWGGVGRLRQLAVTAASAVLAVTGLTGLLPTVIINRLFDLQVADCRPHPLHLPLLYFCLSTPCCSLPVIRTSPHLSRPPPSSSSTTPAAVQVSAHSCLPSSALGAAAADCRTSCSSWPGSRRWLPPPLPSDIPLPRSRPTVQFAPDARRLLLTS